MHIKLARCSYTQDEVYRGSYLRVCVQRSIVRVGLSRWDGELMDFFPGENWSSPWNFVQWGEDRGKKWTAQEMVTQLPWKSSYFESREQSNGKDQLSTLFRGSRSEVVCVCVCVQIYMYICMQFLFLPVLCFYFDMDLKETHFHNIMDMANLV